MFKHKMFVKQNYKVYNIGKIDYDKELVYIENGDLYTNSYYSINDIVFIPYIRNN